MSSLGRLWIGAGPGMYVLVLVFLAAFAAMTLQIVLSRNLIVPGLFRGCCLAVLGTSLAATAIGYRLVFDILFEQGLKPPGLLRGSQVAATPLMFALGMVAVLLVLRLVRDVLGSAEAIGACVTSRVTRLLLGCATLALVSSGLLILFSQIQVSGLAIRGFGDDAGATAGFLTRLIVTGLAMSVTAVILGALAVLVSTASVTRR